MQLLFGAPTLDEPTEVEVANTPLAVIRHSGVALSDLGRLFDSGFAALGQAATNGTIIPAGPALGIYHGDPMQAFDLEIGFTVAQPLDGAIQVDGVTIEPGVTPDGRAMAVSHIGSYDGLTAAWTAFVEAAGARGVEPTDTSIEAYVTDPSGAEGPLRTDLVLFY